MSHAQNLLARIQGLDDITKDLAQDLTGDAVRAAVLPLLDNWRAASQQSPISEFNATSMRADLAAVIDVLEVLRATVAWPKDPAVVIETTRSLLGI